MTKPIRIIQKTLLVLGFYCLVYSAQAQSPEFTSTPVTSGVYNQPYEYQITTSGAAPNRQITLSAGTLPTGLVLTDNGDGTAVINGTPQETGSFPLELKVEDTDEPSNQDIQSFTLEIAKAAATVTVSDLTTTYSGSPQSPTITTDPAGLTVTVTYDGSTTVPTNAGTYAVAATIDDPNYEGMANETFLIEKATATVTLSNLTVTYNGSAQSPTVTTDPSGLTVDITYDGSATAPVDAGSYAVVATINDPNYEGSASDTFIIAKATATVNLSDLTVTYSGSAQSPTVTTDPSGLTVDITYDGSTTTPADAGSYVVVATINDPNHEGSASDTFVIEKAEAVVNLTDLTVTYNGSAQSPAVTTTPTGLSVDLTYDGSSTAPTDAGTYAVVATISDPNYTGSTTNTFTIEKAAAIITLGTLTFEYDGNPKPASATTTPSGLSVEFTYEGSLTPPTLVGSYDIIATIDDPNYQGSTSGTLVINKATATVTLTDLSKTYDGTPKTATVSTTPSGLTVNVTYNGLSTPPVDAGSYTVEAVVDDANYEGSASNTLVIGKATAGITISNLAQNYDGNTKTVDVTTDPEGLGTIITYAGSSTPPSAAGSYAVQVTIDDTNYQGSASATLVINGPPTSSGFPIDVNVNEDASNFIIDLKPVFDDVEDSDSQLTFTVQSNTNPTLFTSIVVNNSKLLIIDFAPNQNGSADVTIRATDTGGLFVDDSFHVSIAAVQDNPSFVSSPVLGALEGLAYSYTAEATDPDVGDVLSYTSVIKPDWLSFTDNGDGTGVLTGTPSSADLGTNSVTLIVSDDKGHLAQQKFDIEVAKSNEKPVFTSTAEVGATEDQLYSYSITTSDADGNDRTVTAPSLPDWLSVTDNGDGTALLQGTPANENVGSSNHVVLRVTDIFGAYNDQSFDITVANTNDAPEFTSEPVTTAKQNVEYTYNIEVSDVDVGDSETISGVVLPGWLSLLDNGDGTASLSGTPPVNAENNLEYEVQLQVEDAGGLTDTQSFTIVVSYENMPPTLNAIADLDPLNEDSGEISVPLSGITAGEGEEQQLTVTATSDNPDLIASVNVDYSSPATTGSISFTSEPDAYGQATITVTVQDDGAEAFNTTTHSFLVTILPVNDLPVFTSSQEDVRLRVGDAFSYTAEVTDADPEDQLAISLSTSASWLSLAKTGDNTASVTGTVPESEYGENVMVTLTVTDPSGGFSTQAFTISVNSRPEVSDIAFAIEEDQQLMLDVADFAAGFTDPDGDAMASVTIKSLPALGQLTWKGTAVAVNDEIPVVSGAIEDLLYTPPADEGGSTGFEWSASDGLDQSGNAVLHIEIESVNDKPILTNIETAPILYRQGDPPVAITTSTIINDVDNTELEGATVRISSGFVKGEDELLYDNLTSQNIVGEFNEAEGVLTLTGTDSRSNYEMALSKISYRNTVLGETDNTEKRIELTVTDGLDSSDPVYREVQITEVLPELGIVNAFTPNGDGVNDYWDFVNLEFYSSIKISVFNEKGTRVFSCGEKNCKWDGTYGGTPLPAGPYFYTVDLNGGKRTYQGTVTILK